jgi:RND family efflux transporter MFP subunit
MKGPLKFILPIIIVAAALLAAYALVNTRAKPEMRQPDSILPVVRSHLVELETVQLLVPSQGTVTPRTESVLVPEVSGRILNVSPSFAAGGFFEEGETLLEIDTHDYRQALIQARSLVAQARLRLAQIDAEAQLARSEWASLGEGEPTALTLFEPQLAEAQASLESALAGVARAEKNIERAVVRAPYAGRVRHKHVDVGQVVSLGTPLATVYAVDFAEVRLPLADQELAYVDLPMGYRGESGSQSGPRVTLRAMFGGSLHKWEGRIVRTEGVIDPQSRMIHTVARIKDPYGKAVAGRPPLAAGMFVDAEIVGNRLEGVAVIPRRALRPDGRILIIDAENRLRFREIEIARAKQETLIVSSGLQTGDRVCTSSLSAVVDGMRVELAAGDS